MKNLNVHRKPSRGWCSRPSRNHRLDRGLRDRCTRTSMGKPNSSGTGPVEINGGKAAQLAAGWHRWEEVVIIFRTWNTVEQALKSKS
jgi:hypothetical protein